MGSWLASVQAGRALLSESAAFQTLVGAVDAAAALAFIYLLAEDAGTPARTDGELDLGYGVVSHAEGSGLSLDSVAGGGGNTYEARGSVVLRIVLPVLEANRAEDMEGAAALAAHTTFDAVLEDLKALSGTGVLMNVVQFSVLQEPVMPPRDVVAKQGHYFWSELQLDWGP